MNRYNDSNRLGFSWGDLRMFLAFVSVVIFFGIIVQADFEIPRAILYPFFILAFFLLLSKGFKKPEICIYALVTYVPFSKILVGDFGGMMTALNFTNILTIIMIVTWIFGNVSQNKKVYTRTSLDIPLLIFIFFGCFSLIKGTFYFGADYAFSFITPLKRWLTPLFFFFIVFNIVKDKKTIKNIILLMMVVLTVVALMAIKDYIDVGSTASLEKSRIGSIAQQPNILAAFFVYYMFLFAGFMLIYWNNVKFWLLSFPFLLCFRGMQVTFSRGGYLAFAAAALTITFFKNKILFFIIAFLLILTVLNPAFLPSGIKYRISSTFTKDQIYSPTLEETIDKSSATRIAIWKGGLEMIKEHKWSGVGYGVFPHLIPYYAPEVGKVDAHNTYILIAAEMGIFALLVFLFILGIIFKNTYKLYRLTRDKFFKAISLGFLGSLGGVLVANIFGGRLDSQEVSSYFWILAALIFRALYIEKHDYNSKLNHAK
ncbi:MAG: O-antigen ligase family protein [Candidatus Omnitrophota bacterium]|jgi:putative inorganic carbon (HCO3(-)) transporter|nr:MAG: O-antigen ligase family protein [Candidatus Omnitrophota bacterium]